MVILPVWLIQPFRAQSSRSLEASYFMRRWSPLVTILAAVVALGLTPFLWRGARLSRALLAASLAILFAVVWFAPKNHFEWMFHPIQNASYARAADVDFLADNDMVMAVENSGDAAAYPVRQMAYHHVVQDVVGGTPVVVTY